MSLPYDECIRLYYSCQFCQRFPAPHNIYAYGEECRACEECYQEYLEEQKALKEKKHED